VVDGFDDGCSWGIETKWLNEPCSSERVSGRLPKNDAHGVDSLSEGNGDDLRIEEASGTCATDFRESSSYFRAVELIPRDH
jgi:hypothetical protein